MSGKVRVRSATGGGERYRSRNGSGGRGGRAASASAASARARALTCVTYGHAGGASSSSSGGGAKTKGFVGEMRKVAMKLHTKEQSPEGEKKKQEEHEGQVRKWQPTLCGYYNFLTQSKHVYDFIEQKVAERALEHTDKKQYSLFVDTGLERSEGLAQDVEYMKARIEESMGADALRGAEASASVEEEQQVGQVYVDYLKELEEKSFPKVMVAKPCPVTASRPLSPLF